MLENIEAVIFDLDGTLIDSMWLWKEIDVIFLRELGYHVPNDLEKDIEGMSFTETAIYFQTRFQLSSSIQEIKDTWHSLAHEKYENDVPLKPSARKFLEFLKEKGIKMGIATSNGIQLVETIAKVHGLHEFMELILTGCDVQKGKPAPDIYLKVAEGLGVKPENCLVFEDLPMGIQGGKNAGMKVCAVQDAFSDWQMDLKKEMADYYIESYEELL